MDQKKVVIFGGGTFSHIRNHFAFAAPAFGGTARRLKFMCESLMKMDAQMILTAMANPQSKIVTNDDLQSACLEVRRDPLTKIVFFTAACVDFEPAVISVGGSRSKEFGSVNMDPISFSITVLILKR